MCQPLHKKRHSPTASGDRTLLKTPDISIAYASPGVVSHVGIFFDKEKIASHPQTPVDEVLRRGGAPSDRSPAGQDPMARNESAKKGIKNYDCINSLESVEGSVGVESVP